MNLFEIELKSRVECLSEFKKLHLRAVTAFTNILKAYKVEITDYECEEFCNNFCAFLFGVYPFVFHTDKQKKAMAVAGIKFKESTVYRMVYGCLVKLIP